MCKGKSIKKCIIKREDDHYKFFKRYILPKSLKDNKLNIIVSHGGYIWNDVLGNKTHHKMNNLDSFLVKYNIDKIKPSVRKTRLSKHKIRLSKHKIRLSKRKVKLPKRKHIITQRLIQSINIQRINQKTGQVNKTTDIVSLNTKYEHYYNCTYKYYKKKLLSTRKPLTTIEEFC